MGWALSKEGSTRHAERRQGTGAMGIVCANHRDNAGQFVQGLQVILIGLFMAVSIGMPLSGFLILARVRGATLLREEALDLLCSAGRLPRLEGSAPARG